MPYRVERPSGPWLEPGQILEDAEFEAHPFHAKFLRTGSVSRLTVAELQAINHPTADAARLAELEAQIPQLQAERAALAAADPPAVADIPPLAPASEPSKGGRPLKYQDSTEFKQHLRIAARAYHYARRQPPSKAALAHALSIGEPTLYAALARFEITDADIQQMIEDRSES